MKKDFVLPALISVLLFTGGCATTGQQVFDMSQVVINSKIIDKPDIGVLTSASVGESMVYAFKERIIPTLVLNYTANTETLFNGFTNYITVEAGELLLDYENTTGRFFKSDQSLTIRGPSGHTNFVEGGVFVNKNKALSAKIYYKNNYNANVYLEDIPSINFKVKEDRHEVIPVGLEETKGSYKRELVYTGISGDTISILYREYVDNMARPAFTQEMKYDLKTSKIIGFKNAKFEIIKADNAAIQYKTLRHL